mgnify:CR=1 FL=1
MKISSISKLYHHYFPHKTEVIKVVEIKDETGGAIETDIWQSDTYNKKGQIQSITAPGGNVNELL